MCDKSLPLIANIQKYSIHDGTGIRTTVFFKGCPLSCLWCHNPEMQGYQGEILAYEERCTGCGTCVWHCPEGAVQMPYITSESSAADVELTEKGLQKSKMQKKLPLTDRHTCNACGSCVEECVYNARELCGKPWSVRELVREICKDRMFYETSGGGVTLSGGEVMAQDMDYVEALLKALRQQGISAYVDTCGQAPWEHFERVLPFVDAFLYDIKAVDSRKHELYTGVGNGRILENLVKLSERNACIWLRLPLIGGVNDSEADLAKLEHFLTEHAIRVKQINLLPYHNTGSSKYARLQLEYAGQDFRVPDGQQMDKWQKRLEKPGMGPVLIGG